MKNENVNGELKKSAIIFYSIGRSSGYQFISAMVASYVLFFMTDIFGIPAAAAGVIVFIVSIWDTINDPIMGIIADRTKTRWGKYRPYLIFAPILFVIATYLLFLNPQGLSAGEKIAWIAVFYFLSESLSTAITIPYCALMPAMTNSEKKRNSMVIAFTIIATITIAIESSFTITLADALGGWNNLVLVAGIIAVSTSWLAVATSKEKYVSTEKNSSLKEQLKAIVKHKELLSVMISWAMGMMGFQIMMASSVYYLTYYICRPNLIITYMGVMSLGGLIGLGVMIPIFNKFIKSGKKGYLVSQAITAVVYVLLFFVGGKSLPALYILTLFAAIFASMCNAYIPMLTNEIVDYMNYSTGEQLNGTMSSIASFATKCGAALSNGSLAVILALTGYVAGNIGGQSEVTLFGINAARFLIPAIAAVLVIVCLKFYPVVGEIKKKIEESKQA